MPQQQRKQKTLALMRHGEAEEGLQDDLRNLTWKGQEQVHDIAEKFEQHGLTFDIIIASSAQRTTETAKIIQQHFDNKPHLLLSPHLYKFQLSHLQDVVRFLSPNISTMLIVGHNPGISKTSNTLSQTSLYFSTAQCTILEHRISETDQDVSFSTLLTRNTWDLLASYIPDIKSI